jgi:hypothetical protein
VTLALKIHYLSMKAIKYMKVAIGRIRRSYFLLIRASILGSIWLKAAEGSLLVISKVASISRSKCSTTAFSLIMRIIARGLKELTSEK